ncbi:hypothetical protein Efla_006808 [Eimeria flavescens]
MATQREEAPALKAAVFEPRLRVESEVRALQWQPPESYRLRCLSLERPVETPARSRARTRVTTRRVWLAPAAVSILAAAPEMPSRPSRAAVETETGDRDSPVSEFSVAYARPTRRSVSAAPPPRLFAALPELATASAPSLWSLHLQPVCPHERQAQQNRGLGALLGGAQAPRRGPPRWAWSRLPPLKRPRREVSCPPPRKPQDPDPAPDAAAGVGWPPERSAPSPSPLQNPPGPTREVTLPGPPALLVPLAPRPEGAAGSVVSPAPTSLRAAVPAPLRYVRVCRGPPKGFCAECPCVDACYSVA